MFAFKDGEQIYPDTKAGYCLDCGEYDSKLAQTPGRGVCDGCVDREQRLIVDREEHQSGKPGA